MKFAYADPPYPGQAKRHYGSETEVNHAELIEHLTEDFPDGWALSTSSVALKEVLALCPNGVRVMAWVKPWASWKPGINPTYAWEPVIVFGGRPRTREQLTVRDWVSVNMTMQRGLCGVKPKEFCYWIFDVLNIQHGDELEDIFPGTGAIGLAFKDYIKTKQVTFNME